MSNNKDFAEGMLKGRMAESMVEEILRKSGNSVYRFGYEAILQNLTQIQKAFDRHTDAGERIHSIPDFIVLDKKSEPILLEVKFRFDGKLYGDDKERLQKIKEFWNAKVLFVNCTEKPYFRITDPPYLNDTGELLTKPLLEEESWKIDEEIYRETEILVEKYLKSALLKKN